MQTATQQQPSAFLRQKSGLVKVANFWDVFIYNVGLISVGIGVAYTQRFGSAYYPHSSIPIATFFAATLMTFVVLGFWTWTTAIPRSGGIYIFLTRTGWPAFGFALSFAECVSWLFYVAIAAKLIATVGLIPLASIWFEPSSGVIQWLTSASGQLVVGTIVIWLAAILLISGTRTYLRVQRVVFAVAVVGTIILLVSLAAEGAHETFRQNFNRVFANLGTDPSRVVLQQAQQMNWQGSQNHQFWHSVMLLVWPFLPLIGAAFSIAIGGEIRNTSRNQIRGMTASLWFCAVSFILITKWGNSSIGTEFQGALAYNFDNPSANNVTGSTPFEPYFSYLALLTTSNVAFRFLIALGFLAWVWFWIPGVIAYTERAFLAWALDRAAPSWFAKLHPQLASPYVAIIIGSVVAQLFLILTLYTSLFKTLVFILAAAVAWCITLILGVFFPFLRRRMFDGSALAGKRAGLPMMVGFCAMGACSLAFVIWLLWNDSLAAGHDPKSLIAVGGTFGLGFVGYLAMKSFRKSRGIDISHAYKEIPVDTE